MSVVSPAGRVIGGPRPWGFSLIEVLSVVAIVGLLASLVPASFDHAANRAMAARILADVHTLEQAARRLRGETGAYPSSAAWTEVPRELVDRLEGMSFENNEIWYMWWAPGRYRGVLIYTSGDPEVLAMVTAAYSGRDFNWGQFAYLVIDQERI